MSTNYGKKWVSQDGKRGVFGLWGGGFGCYDLQGEIGTLRFTVVDSNDANDFLEGLDVLGLKFFPPK